MKKQLLVFIKHLNLKIIEPKKVEKDDKKAEEEEPMEVEQFDGKL